MYCSDFHARRLDFFEAKKREPSKSIIEKIANIYILYTYICNYIYVIYVIAYIYTWNSE